MNFIFFVDLQININFSLALKSVYAGTPSNYLKHHKSNMIYNLI